MFWACVSVVPLSFVYDSSKAGNIIKSGCVSWSARTITISVDDEVAYVTLRFKAGPYGDRASEEIVWWIKENTKGKK